jgi:hypothetical protein
VVTTGATRPRKRDAEETAIDLVDQVQLGGSLPRTSLIHKEKEKE